ncbi:hypothetical protein FZC84_11890 [Rossellomorea vietnamensis]|uniref:Uncharacterized protein n=1 Tax=Rossellomorea vietnamensis TaxID=218284 RepID=A0A5D4MBT2_9BACI|nr:hypothetical protein [Rossellomorea vietnamensis]TYR99071.1 hypothetical protein FZC84_11890 [Rossellomorea vietnamensis]
MVDVEEMTLTEFHYKRYAQEYKEIDEEYKLHKLAFLIRNADAKVNKGTEKKPKEEYAFKEFKEFFDYEGALNEVDKGFVVKKEVAKQKKLSPAQIALQRNARKG